MEGGRKRGGHGGRDAGERKGIKNTNLITLFPCLEA